MNTIITIILTCLILTGCTRESSSIGIIGGADGPTAIIVGEKTDNEETSEKGVENMNSYEIITQDKAKEIMDSDIQHIVLDVREQSEYDEGHIEGAILIPHEEITEKAESVLPDKDALILVYCRSGRRSKIASEALANLGYSNVKEFGGIIDWQYDIVK